MKTKFLAAKISLSAALAFFSFSHASGQGIPVVDAANLKQNLINTTESVAQTLKQIEQYRIQLQQYENELRNTIAPSAYIWSQAQNTMNSLMNATNTLEYYRAQYGSIDKYLKKFQDVSYYRNSPCFQPGFKCSPAELAIFEENRTLASESQKRANDAMFEGMHKQQRNILNDAQQLEELQRRAQGAKGQMEAISYANQIAAQQSNQLLQIRGLLMAQQNAVGTQMQANLDRESRQQAISEKVRQNNFQQSPKKAW